LGQAIRGCVEALSSLGIVPSATEVLALFPEPPSGQLAEKGFTEEEIRDSGVQVSSYFRSDRINWFDDRSYIYSSIEKLGNLYQLQGLLDVLCRQIELCPSVAADPPDITKSLFREPRKDLESRGFTASNSASGTDSARSPSDPLPPANAALLPEGDLATGPASPPEESRKAEESAAGPDGSPRENHQTAPLGTDGETPLEITLDLLKGTSKAKTLVRFLSEQSTGKATLKAVTRRLYSKGHEPTTKQQAKAKQQIRRTAKALDELKAPLRIEWDWDRDEISLVVAAAKPGPAKPSGKDVADVAR
jgi:hypothetical protein